MNTLNDISILIVSAVTDKKRLLEVYYHTRELYPTVEIVIVYDNISTNQIELNDPYLIQVPTTSRVYVSGGYNLALRNSTKSLFVFLHDDTYVAPNFLENLLPHINHSVFCNFCQVEPPVFNNPDSVDKPVRDFGLRYTPFEKDNFIQFCKKREDNLPYLVKESPYGGFFMAGMKESILSVRGFDETFQPYFFEDSDLIVRLLQAGFSFKLILNSIVYHVGSLTSRSSEEGNISFDTTFKIFLSKWKTTFEYFKLYTIDNKIPYKRILNRIVCNECSENLEKLTHILSDSNGTVLTTVDGKRFDQNEVDLLLQLPYIINSIEEKGKYILGNIKIELE